MTLGTRTRVAAVVVAAVVLAAPAAAHAGGSGILRVGTTTYIDSLNPFNYIESQAYNAMIMIYPQLVQYTHGKTGYCDRGRLGEVVDAPRRTARRGRSICRSGTKWSDGKPMTAADAAWTINTIVKYANGAAAVAAPALAHVKNADGAEPDDARRSTTRRRSGTCSRSSSSSSSCPKHVYGSSTRHADGQGPEDVPPRAAPADGDRRRLHAQVVREEGHDGLHAEPELLGAAVERRRRRAARTTRTPTR